MGIVGGTQSAATGKAILAAATNDVRGWVLEHELERLTPRTIVDPVVLCRRQIAQVGGRS